jgi:hypothetical protein
VIDENSNFLSISDRKFMHFQGMLFGRHIVNQEGVFWRKTVYDKTGELDVKLKYAMDYDFFLRICKIYSPVKVDNILACHRKHKDQKTTNITAYYQEMNIVREQHRTALGIGKVRFLFNEAIESRKRRLRIFGLKGLYNKEWMDCF